jgi:hypothetical protein
MKMSSKLATIAGLATITAIALGGAATAASAATPSTATPSGTATVQDGSCTTGWTGGWTSVDMTITNNTTFPLTYDPTVSGPSAGHWHERPVTTLQPGQCEVVNAYAPTDVSVFNLNVVYTTPWGDTMPFEGTAMSTSPSFNPNVFEGTPQYHSNNYYWSGAIDSRYSITSSGQSGLLHTQFGLELS